MGFSIGGMISGAMSGAMAGSSAGPYGAIAGGIAGGAAGGFGVGGYGGGPTSVGGISGLGGRGAGQEASKYYDEAFPGTNPWERLGAGNPMGGMISSAIQARTAERNVGHQMATSKANVATQTSAAVQVAKIHGRAAGVSAAQTQDPGAEKRYGDYIAENVDPKVTAPSAQMRGAGAQEQTAKANELNSWTNQKMADLKSRQLDIETGKAFHNPATARLAAVATHAFDIGMEQTTFVKWMRDNPKKLAAMGVTVAATKELGSVLGSIFGRVKMIPKKTSVRGVR